MAVAGAACDRSESRLLIRAMDAVDRDAPAYAWARSSRCHHSRRITMFMLAGMLAGAARASSPPTPSSRRRRFVPIRLMSTSSPLYSAWARNRD